MFLRFYITFRRDFKGKKQSLNYMKQFPMKVLSHFMLNQLKPLYIGQKYVSVKIYC